MRTILVIAAFLLIGGTSAFASDIADVRAHDHHVGVAAAGFVGLLLSVVSGFTFVEDLFAQHLVHKTALSLLALILFGIVVGGRFLAGWRGRRAVYLYLGGFAVLCLAYFGSRFILEEVLGRSWS